MLNDKIVRNSFFSLFFLFASLTFLSCTQTKYKNPHIEIQTRLGDIELELYPDRAPKTVAAMLANIEAEIYKNSTFYRVLSRDNLPTTAEKTEIIQGGIWKSKTAKRTERPNIPHETTKQTGISHKDGVISLARLEPGTATTEFFICIGDQPSFDYGNATGTDKQGYAAFGKVLKGMEIVRRIHNRPETDQHFDPPIDIYNIVKL